MADNPFLTEMRRRGEDTSGIITQMPVSDTVDETRGAPASVRAAVGAAQTPQDRLATLRQFLPDAQPFRGDNFVFTDPETGRPTLYNPPGLDLGDLASIGPELGEVAGGAVGAALATPAALAAAPATGGVSLATIPLAVGLGAGAGREAVTLSAANLGRTIDTRGLPRRLGDAAVTVAGNAIGQRVGDVLAQGVGSVFGPVLRRPFTGTTTRQLQADFENLGVRPLAGALTGNRAVGILEQGLANIPGSASTIQRAATEAVEQLGAANERLAVRYANDGLDAILTSEGMGEAIQASLQRASQRFTNRQTALYDGVYAQIPGDGLAGVSAIDALKAELQQSLARAPESLRNQLGPALRELKQLTTDAAGAGGIPFGALREVRTALGKRIGDPVLVGENSAQRQYLQRVYAALTEDMNRHAAAVSPQAIRDLMRADRYTRRMINERFPIINKVLDAGTPEQVFRMVFGGPTSPGQAIQLGGSAVRQVRRNMPDEEWDVVAGSFLRRMGLARPGGQADVAIDESAQVFSPAVFITRWNQLSPEARLGIFGGTRYSELIPELNALVRATNAVQQAERLANTSGTTRTLLVGGTLGIMGERLLRGDLAGAATAGGGTIVAPWISAKLITNPGFVRWLTGTVQSVNAGTPTLTGRITRLIAVAEANPEIREEVGQYIDALRELDTALLQLPAPQATTAPPAPVPTAP